MIVSKRSKHMSLAAAAAAALATLAGGAVVRAEEPSPAELRAQIEALQAKVQQLEANQQQQQNRSVDGAVVDSTVDRVLLDAERRSQLLQADGQILGGYDKGFVLRSADGNFVLRPGLWLQFRNVTNYRDEAPDGDEDLQNGSELRRVRFRFDGNAFTPDLTYSFVWDVNRNSGNTSLLDAWVKYQFADEWGVRLGQFKESFSHEKDVSGGSQLAVDRSIVDQLIGGSLTDRVQGAALVYGDGEGNLRAEFALHDGADSGNTDFRDGSTYVGGGARVEYKASGDWGSYRDFTAKNTKEDLLVFGGGADWTDQPGGSQTLLTADAQWENTAGLGIYAAVHGAYVDVREPGAPDDSQFNYGALAQVGYLLNPSWEVFGRVAWVGLDDDFFADDSFTEITAGVNYYLGPDGAYLHKAKITVDVGVLPDGAPSDLTGIGVLASDDFQAYLRGQFQLML